MEIELYLKAIKQEIEQYLDKHFPENRPPKPLGDAMRYALLNGGKRLRAILTITIARGLNGLDEHIFPYAAALEMIHAYSLVHDDLPALDNDEYRRGQLTTHKKFGEAMGILAGDALLTHAFWFISNYIKDFSISAELTSTLSWYAGIGGMVSGQVADIMAERQKQPNEILEDSATPAILLDYIHNNKTMALIFAACKGGAVIGKANSEIRNKIAVYGQKIGLAFQIVDDILDVVGDEKNMGKKVNKDQSLGKLTYPGIWGLEQAQQKANQLVDEACKSIADLPSSEYLIGIAKFITARTY